MRHRILRRSGCIVRCPRQKAVLRQLRKNTAKNRQVEDKVYIMEYNPGLLDKFRLNIDQLNEIADTLCQRIKTGLTQDGQEIRAIPAYLAPPPEGLHGQALIVDIGGTNIRAAIVELDPDGSHKILTGPIRATVPAGRQGESITAEEFFDAQARLALQLNPSPNLPVGYCFSYSAQSTPDADARLINWTKDVHIDGVVGNLVGKMLSEAMIRRGYHPGKVTVLNDTVAALLAGAGAHADKYDYYIGLIAGTGTNMAGFVSSGSNNKLSRLDWHEESMAVNLESGNFTPPYLNQYDEMLDESMDMPGRQRFEKALAGYYLPFIYAKANPEAEKFDPYGGTGLLARLRDEEHDELAEVIMTRSGNLIAAGLAGFIKALGDKGRVCITAEGSRYWADPLLAPQVAGILPKLTGPNLSFSIVKVEDANILGSAYAALARA